MTNFIAIDLGAESGRTMLGRLDDGRLAIEELHRFANEGVVLPTGLYWNSVGIFQEIVRGLAIYSTKSRAVPDGIGIDTWGVDFALLAEDGTLIDNPRHYRDARNRRMSGRVCERIGKEEIFRQTGIQFLDINTLCQLGAMAQADAPALRIAARLLFMPDLFNYWLTGKMRCELTIASTSQFYDSREKRWANEMLDALGVPGSLPAEIIEPGTMLGTLLPKVASACGMPENVRVFATASHDTASAVAAVPASGDSWCYISSGTWSLMGVEVAEPVITERARELNFTNEAGAAGRIRLLKNIAGLWLVQECRREWALAGREYSYEQLTAMAAEAEPCGTLLDPDAFQQPGGMPGQIARYCERTGQRTPGEPGQMCRVILESLARTYARVLGNLEELTGRRMEVIHIVGGGSRNELLNRLTAEATGRTVIAGPVEATAAGNILVQAMGSGVVKSLDEAREVVRRSFPLKVYEARRR